MIGSPARAPSDRRWVEVACGSVAFVLPLAVTLLRLTPATQWRDDLAIFRGLGLVPVGAEGVLSTVLMQALSLVPVGGRVARAALASALGLALGSRLLYGWTHRLLLANAPTPAFAPLLALAAALLSTLSPSWQLEGTIAGGATLATAVALGPGLIRSDPRPLQARQWLAGAALVGLATLESRPAGLVALVVVATQALILLDLPSRRMAVLAAVGALSVLVLGLGPLLGRSLGADRWMSLGWPKNLGGVGQWLPAGRPGSLGAWIADLGVVAVALAGLGVLWGLGRARLRAIAVPLAVLGVLDLGLGGSGAESLLPLRLGALGALGVFGALGVHTAWLALSRAKIPYARATRVLLVVFFFTLVTLGAEDSSFVADRRTRYAAEVWTDEALGALPRRSVVLVRSEALALHLWAARVVRGERPDLLIAPVALLERPAFARRMIALEPAVQPLIRDLVARGQPSEFALSSIADLRPLVVELDPSWDHRLLEHLLPEPFWLAFSPHPLGRSDRAQAVVHGRDSFRRAVTMATDPLEGDAYTASVLAAEARAQAATLAALGDREEVAPILVDLKQLEPESRFASELERRLGQKKRGAIPMSGLWE